MFRLFRSTLILIIALMMLVGTAWAAPGVPDTAGDLDVSFAGFSGGSVVTTGVPMPTPHFDEDERRGMALQPDGKIVVAGNQAFNGDENFALARFEATFNTTAPVFRVFLPLVSR